MVFCLISPWPGFSGGEFSGGGIYLYPTQHMFGTRGQARLAFDRLENGTKAYWSSDFAKAVPKVRLHPESKDRFVADAEICIEGDQVRSVVPGNYSDQFISVPVEWEVEECRRWRVDRDDSGLPRVFYSKVAAENWIQDNRSKADSEPYCLDADWKVVKKTPPLSYQVSFLADIRGEDELYEVGRVRFKLFSCRDLERIALSSQLGYQNYVEDRDFDRDDWVQMAGGEFSGGGRPKRSN